MEEAASNGKHEEVKKEEEVIKDDGEYQKTEVENESSEEIVIDGIPEKVTESLENNELRSSSKDDSNEETGPEKTKEDPPVMEDKVVEPVVDVAEPANPEEKELGENPEESHVAEVENNEVEILSTAADKSNPNGVAVTEKAIEESQEPEDLASVAVEKSAVVAAVEEAVEAKANEVTESVVQPKEESVDAGESSGTAKTAEVGESVVENKQQVPESAPHTSADETSTKREIPESANTVSAWVNLVTQINGISREASKFLMMFCISQPILSVAHGTYQRTSWKSCCGLFEVLRRSDR